MRLPKQGGAKGFLTYYGIKKRWAVDPPKNHPDDSSGWLGLQRCCYMYEKATNELWFVSVSIGDALFKFFATDGDCATSASLSCSDGWLSFLCFLHCRNLVHGVVDGDVAARTVSTASDGCSTNTTGCYSSPFYRDVAARAAISTATNTSSRITGIGSDVSAKDQHWRTCDMDAKIRKK